MIQGMYVIILLYTSITTPKTPSDPLGGMVHCSVVRWVGCIVKAFGDPSLLIDHSDMLGRFPFPCLSPMPGSPLILFSRC